MANQVTNLRKFKIFTLFYEASNKFTLKINKILNYLMYILCFLHIFLFTTGKYKFQKRSGTQNYDFDYFLYN